MRICALAFLACSLAACGPSAERGPLDVGIFGDDDALLEEGVRLSPAAQHLRAATSEGLVSLDSTGQVVPALAERWIVTDDGLSYIFRLRNSAWPDGEAVTAAEVRTLLRDTIGRLDGTSLGLDLAKVTDIRAMTGRVVELRLSGPMPEFLRLLAQPELGLVYRGSGAGPMLMSLDDELPIARLSALPPQDRGLPARENWEDGARGLVFRTMVGQEAVDAFTNGDVDLLMGGTLSTFPLVELGPLSRGAIQVDPAIGLFGLIIRSEDGVLADPARREALSMAIDRIDLIQPFGLGGWRSTNWIIPPELFSPPQYPISRWPDLSVEQRREIALARISAWESSSDEEAVLRIGLPDGPGSDILFEQLSLAWSQIGVTSVRVGMGEGAEIELRDRLARYSSPRWFLNQFNCELEIGLCSEEADALVQESLSLRDVEAKQALLADSHAELTAREAYIPLGVPVRWSLVRGSVEGYEANPWGLHPLFPLSQPTT